jgi:hypothetical protein
MNWLSPRSRAKRPNPAVRPSLEVLEARILLNSPPTLTVPAAQSVAEGQSISLIVSAYDPDGDSMTFSATGMPAGVSINATSGLINGWVDFGDGGFFPPSLYSSEVDVNDVSYVVSASLSWTVNFTNALPSAGPQSNSEGQSVSLSMAGTDNVPGDSLSYSASGLPGGLGINASTGLISGIPLYSDTGFASTATFSPVVSLAINFTDTMQRSLSWTVTETNRFPSTSLAAYPLDIARGLYHRSGCLSRHGRYGQHRHRFVDL